MLERRTILLSLFALVFVAPVSVLVVERVGVTRFREQAERVAGGQPIAHVLDRLGAPDRTTSSPGEPTSYFFRRIPTTLRRVVDLPCMDKLLPHDWTVGYELHVSDLGGKADCVWLHRHEPSAFIYTTF